VIIVCFSMERSSNDCKDTNRNGGMKSRNLPILLQNDHLSCMQSTIFSPMPFSK
jgi:hypothetical protein